MAQSDAQPSFFKQLAANDKQARDAAVASLRTYLTHRTELSSLELLKLWKGLFYCMWMSDKPRNQQQLARDLASLIEVLAPKVVLPFLDTFWKTMAREWGGIDVLRMDKFLYLVRQYLLASFKWFARKGWKDGEMLEEYMGILRETPLNPTEMRIPNGLRYHIIDIYVDELDNVEEVAEDEESNTPFKTLLAPLQELGKESPTKTIRDRVKVALEDERVKGWLGESTPSNENAVAEKDVEADEWGGIED